MESLIYVRVHVALGMRRLRMLIRKMTQPRRPLRESLLAVIALVLRRIAVRIFDMVVHRALIDGRLLAMRTDVLAGGVLGIMSRHGEGVLVSEGATGIQFFERSCLVSAYIRLDCLDCLRCLLRLCRVPRRGGWIPNIPAPPAYGRGGGASHIEATFVANHPANLAAAVAAVAADAATRNTGSFLALAINASSERASAAAERAEAGAPPPINRSRDTALAAATSGDTRRSGSPVDVRTRAVTV